MLDFLITVGLVSWDDRSEIELSPGTCLFFNLEDLKLIVNTNSDSCIFFFFFFYILFFVVVVLFKSYRGYP